MKPLFEKHMNDIMSGHFSETMMKDWDNNDSDLLRWRTKLEKSGFTDTASSH